MHECIPSQQLSLYPSGLQSAMDMPPPPTGMADPSWANLEGGLDWRYLDQVLSQREQAQDEQMEMDWLVGGPSLGDFNGLEMAPRIQDGWFQR
jgi:hypothetical protein